MWLPKQELWLLWTLCGGLLSSVQSERQYSQVVFTAEKCAELGYDKEFDVCAVMEFCGTGEREDEDRKNRKNRKNRKKHRYLRRNVAATANRKLQEDDTDEELWWPDEKQDPSDPFGKHEETDWDTTGSSFGQDVEVAKEEQEEKKEQEQQDKQQQEQHQGGQAPPAGALDHPGMDKPPPANPGKDLPSSPLTPPANPGQPQKPPKPQTPAVHAANQQAEDDEDDDDDFYNDESEEDDQGNDQDGPPPSVKTKPPPGGPGQQPQQHPPQPGTPPAEPETRANSAAYGWRVPGTTECTYPGPILRMKQGLKHGLIVQSAVEDDDVVTNLHFHGLHIAGHGNGDDVHRSLAKGASIVYALDLTNHMGGTYWYHSHAVGQSLEQTEGGAFGMIVVDENPQAQPVGTTDPKVLDFLTNNERILIVDDTKNNQWAANGLNRRDTFEFVKDQWYRMRVMMVSLNPHGSGGILTFGPKQQQDATAQCTVYAIAHDGILRRTVPKVPLQDGQAPQTEFPLTSSSRVDVAIKCQEGTDIPININHSLVASIRVVAGSNNGATPLEGGTQPWQTARLPYVQDMSSSSSIDNRWSIHVEGTNINGVNWSSHQPLCTGDEDEDFEYGSVQEWTVKGTATHPMHVHTYPMQIVSGCGDYHDEGEFYDTILATNIRHAGEKTPSHHASTKKCKVRVHLVDVAGPVLVHCHIFVHAEHGAMGWINVVNGGPVQPDEPRVHSCPTNMVCDPAPQPVRLCHGSA